MAFFDGICLRAKLFNAMRYHEAHRTTGRASSVRDVGVLMVLTIGGRQEAGNLVIITLPYVTFYFNIRRSATDLPLLPLFAGPISLLVRSCLSPPTLYYALKPPPLPFR